MLILFVGVLGISIGNQSMNTPVVTNDLMLENVEALANMEIVSPQITCWASGEFICPNDGVKVRAVYQGYGLRK